jgi:hypothetical protein
VIVKTRSEGRLRLVSAVDPQSIDTYPNVPPALGGVQEASGPALGNP